MCNVLDTHHCKIQPDFLISGMVSDMFKFIMYHAPLYTYGILVCLITSSASPFLYCIFFEMYFFLDND